MKKYLLIAALIISSTINLFSTNIPDFTKLAQQMGATNEGSEFYLTFHPGPVNDSTSVKIQIFVASREECQVLLEIPFLKINKKLTVLPQKASYFELTPGEAMMYFEQGKSAIKPQVTRSWTGRAIHITSDKPIVCYGMFNADYYGEGFMAIPVKNWDKTYQISSFADPTDNINAYLPSFTSIIASQDDTKIEFTVGGTSSTAIPIDQTTDLKFNETLKTIINKGDVLLIPGKFAYHDLSGSRIKADKPVGVISGDYCAYIPTEAEHCNYLIEMDQPEFSWGKKYYIPIIANRLKSPLIKIYTKVVPNDLYKDNILYGSITSNDGKRFSGWLEKRSNDGSPKPAIFSGDTNINVVLYNTGSGDDGVQSSPFQMNLIPTSQFQNDIIFVVPNSDTNTPFQDTYLSLMYHTENEYEIPNDIMLGWTGSSGFTRHPVKTLVSETGTLLESDTSGGYWMTLTVKLPGYSYYEMKADKPFGAYCYGNSETKSFGYPAAGMYLDFDGEDNVPPYCDYTYDSTEKTYKGKIYDVSQNPLKLAGLNSIQSFSSNTYNVLFTYNFDKSVNDTADFLIKPIDPYMDAYAGIYARDDNDNDTIFIFKYIAPREYPVIDKKIIDLGYTKVNEKLISDSIYIKNPSDRKMAFTIDSLLILNNTPGFNIIPGNTIGKELQKQDSIAIKLEFVSGNEGEYIDSLGIKANNSVIYYTEIKANVVHSEISCDSTIDFGNVDTNGAASTRNITINNNSKVDLLLTGVDLTVSNDFVLEPITFSQLNPLILTPGESKQLSMTFTPTHTGDYLDSIKINNDGTGRKTILVKGRGLTTGINNEINLKEIQLILSGDILKFNTLSDIYVKSLEIYDLRGLKLYELNSDNYLNNTSVTINNFYPGLYLITIKSDIGMIIRSFTIIK